MYQVNRERVGIIHRENTDLNGGPQVRVTDNRQKCHSMSHLVALVLIGDVPKWSGQGHFEDTYGTRPGHVRPVTHF